MKICCKKTKVNDSLCQNDVEKWEKTENWTQEVISSKLLKIKTLSTGKDE